MIGTQDGALVLWELLSYCWPWERLNEFSFSLTASMLFRLIGFSKIAIESSNLLEFYHAPGLNKSHATYQRNRYFYF